MDPSLLKQRADFMKRAAAVPTVAKRPNVPAANDAKSSKRKPQAPGVGSLMPKRQKPASNFDYKAATASMSSNFGLLSKIVDHLKKRHLEQKYWSLTFEEILDEIQAFDLTRQTKNFLTEVLHKNDRVESDGSGRFCYRPPYRIKGKNSLLNLLKRNDLDGSGALLYSKLLDSVAAPDKLVQALGGSVIEINVLNNKRKDKVLFYNDDDSQVEMDEEFKALWRGVAVDHLDERKIDEYLQKHGIDSMHDLGPKRPSAAHVPKRKTAKKRGTLMHNEHLASQLKDFSTQ